MSLIDVDEPPNFEGPDQQEQIRQELYSQIIKDLTEKQIDLATNYSVLNPNDFKTPMDWITDQANKALLAFDAQFPKAEQPDTIQTADKAP